MLTTEMAAHFHFHNTAQVVHNTYNHCDEVYTYQQYTRTSALLACLY